MSGNGDPANIVRRLVLGVVFLWLGIPDEWRLGVIIIDALQRVAIILHLENMPMWYLPLSRWLLIILGWLQFPIDLHFLKRRLSE